MTELEKIAPRLGRAHRERQRELQYIDLLRYLYSTHVVIYDPPPSRFQDAENLYNRAAEWVRRGDFP